MDDGKPIHIQRYRKSAQSERIQHNQVPQEEIQVAEEVQLDLLGNTPQQVNIWEETQLLSSVQIIARRMEAQ